MAREELCELEVKREKSYQKERENGGKSKFGIENNRYIHKIM